MDKKSGEMKIKSQRGLKRMNGRKRMKWNEKKEENKETNKQTIKQTNKQTE